MDFDFECWAHVHVAAHHVAAPQYASFTPGVGVLCRDEAWLAGASLLRQSLERPALYAFAGYQPLRVGSVRVGAVVGVRTRPVFGVIDNTNWTWRPETYEGDDVAPIAAVAVSWRFNLQAEAHLQIIPRIPNVTPATFAGSVSWKWQ